MVQENHSKLEGEDHIEESVNTAEKETNIMNLDLLFSNNEKMYRKGERRVC